MPEKIQGIVLDSIKFKENSSICKLYTKQHGFISIIVNGMGNGKNKLSTIYFQPLTKIECIVYIKDKGALFKAKDIAILTSSFGPVPDIIRNSISVFIAEIVLRTVKEFHPDDDIYNLLEKSVSDISNPNLNINSMHLYFLCSYIECLGFSIRDEFEKEHLFIQKLDLNAKSKFMELVSMKEYINIEISKTNRSKLLNFMLLYLGQHSDLPKIKSLKILEEIMS